MIILLYLYLILYLYLTGCAFFGWAFYELGKDGQLEDLSEEHIQIVFAIIVLLWPVLVPIALLVKDPDELE